MRETRLFFVLALLSGSQLALAQETPTTLPDSAPAVASPDSAPPTAAPASLAPDVVAPPAPPAVTPGAVVLPGAGAPRDVGAVKDTEQTAITAAPPTPAQKPSYYASVPPFSKIQLKLEGSNGTSIRFGAVTQLQYEAVGSYGEHDVSQNLFVRRTMLLLAGTVLHDLEYFVDTDFADLFKAAGDMSLKQGPGISLKDVFITYAGFGDVFKIDGGLMLPPLSHSSLQGAPFLLGLDFFANTYRHGAVFGTTANAFGRDLGLQLRGLLFGGHLEYRAGVFQGKRSAPEAGHAASRNPFRAAGRVQVNVLDAETAFFYRGTYLGEKRLLSLGATFDVQPSEDDGTYRAWGLDALVDVDGIAGQINYVSRNGDGFVALPKQDALSAEAGYLIQVLRLSPIVRFERRWGPGTALDETLIGGGLAFWAFNHTSNIKAFYVRGKPGGAVRDYDQFNAQWQLAFF